MNVHSIYYYLLSSFVYFNLIFFDFSTARRQFFEVRPTNVTVKEGQTAILRCTVGNQANVGQTFWTQNGVGLGFDYDLGAYPRYKVVGVHSRGEYHLEISDVKLSDDASYECQVQPAVGEEGLRAAAHLTVLVPPDKIVIDGHRSGSVVEIRSGKLLDVICRASGGKPEPDMRWVRTENGHETEMKESVVRVTQESHEDGRITGIAHLRMPVNASDSGAVFTCQAHHKALPASHSLRANFSLSVIYPSGRPSIQGYDERTLRAGERLHLQCLVKNGNPYPEVHWMKNKNIFDRSYTNNQEYSRNDYEFTVDASDNDAEYTCVAHNTASASPLSKSVKLKVVYPPTKVTIVGPDEAKIGDTVELTCQTSESNPPAKISWIFDGRPIEEHPRVQIHGLITTSTINVKITKEKRDVVVTCSAFNDEVLNSNSFTGDGQVRDSKSINVHYPPESVIIYGYENKAISAGSTIILTCIAMGGNPKAELTWYKGEKRVTQGVSDPSVTEVNSQRTLTITVNKDDNGADYKCSATNAATDIALEAHAKLSVYFPPDRVTISVSPEKLSAGQTADLTCETDSGNPAPLITWRRKSSSEILPSQDIYNKSAAFGGWEVKNRMRILLTPEDDGATFRCSATSSALNESMNDDVTVAVYFKPIFSMTSPQEIHVLEKEFVSLNAFAIGNPQVMRYEWTKDGVPIGRLDRRRSQIFVSGSNLNISNVDREDSGSYYCMAHNEQGSTSLMFRLSVKYPAKITSILTPVYAEPGGYAKFECEADANPKPETMVRWERRDFPEFRMQRSYGDNIAYLKVINIKPEDAGEFVCTASNGVGASDQKSALLLVKRQPQIDRSPIYLKSAAEKGKEAVLTCVADGVPEVTFFWTKENDEGGEPLYDNAGNIHIESTQLSQTRYQTVLTLKDVTESDYGSYTCMARNDLPATDTLTIRLNITSIPESPSLIPNPNVTHNSAIISWTPGFDGGLIQRYRLKYHVIGAPHQPRVLEVPASEQTSTVIEGLLPNTKYLFSIESYNDLGPSGFSSQGLNIQTLEAPTVSQQSLKEEIPIMIIVFVSIIGIILLALNVFLICCFIRRHQKKKLQAMDKRKMLENKTAQSTDGSVTSSEKAAAARLVEPIGHKIQMYSSDASGTSGGILRPESQYTDHEPRPRSGYSDDETSVRTVIEVDSNGQPMFVEHLSPHSHATYLLDDHHGNYSDGPSNALYAETLRTNSLQRHLAGGLYSVNPGYQDAKKLLYSQMPGSSPSDDAVPPAMGPLRSISQELNNYAPYSHYNPPPPASGSKNGLVRRYSPPNQTFASHSNPIPTLVQSNGRTPYAEVRPILTQQNGVGSNHSQGGSPVLSTFAAPRSSNMCSKPDYVDLEGLPGDLV